MKTIPDETPLNRMTLGQLKAALIGIMPQAEVKAGSEKVPARIKHPIYGIKGIEDLFHVSHKTAQNYKNTFLQPAVYQRERIIVTDRDLALELFNEWKTRGRSGNNTAETCV